MSKKNPVKYVGKLGSNFDSMAYIVASMDGVNILNQNMLTGELVVLMSGYRLEEFELMLKGAKFREVGHQPQKYFISQQHRVEVFIAPHHTAKYDPEMDVWYRKVEIYHLNES